MEEGGGHRKIEGLLKEEVDFGEIRCKALPHHILLIATDSVGSVGIMCSSVQQAQPLCIAKGLPTYNRFFETLFVC
jgi:hypothetical protein